jgi:hypothetical protein
MRHFILAMFLFISSAGYAQNLQLHYDFGEGRQYLTSTVEMFKPDSFGSTFFFIDMDYDEGVSLAYWEIARDLKFWKAPITMHFEYNGGNAGFSFPNNYLLGGAYSFAIGENYFTTQLLYKHFSYGSDAPDFQWTNIWISKPMFNNKVYFMGYVDIWSQDKRTDGKQLIFQSEPQLWYALFENGWWIGTEVEISKNFLSSLKWQFMPTIGVKYEF